MAAVARTVLCSGDRCLESYTQEKGGGKVKIFFK